MAECWRHGRHAGWECPTCAIERATEKAAQEAGKAAREIADAERDAARLTTEAIREASEAASETAREAAESTVEAIQAGIAAQKQIARESWKLQANAKIERALELLSAGLEEESVALAREALKEDPSSLLGHATLARSLLNLGAREEGTAEFKKAIQLLDVSNAAGDAAYQWLLALMPREISPDVINALKQRIRTFAGQASEALSAELLIDLARKGWIEEADVVAGSISVRKFSHDVATRILEAGARKSVVILSRRVAEAGGKAEDVSLWSLGALWQFESMTRTGIGDRQAVIGCIGHWTHERGAKAISSLTRDYAQFEQIFSSQTLRDFTTAMEGLYGEWRPRIQRDCEIAGDRAYKRVGFGLGCVGVVIAAAVMAALSAILYEGTKSGNAATIVWWTGMLLTIVALVLENRRRRDAARSSALASMRRDLAILEKRYADSIGSLKILPLIAIGFLAAAATASDRRFVCLTGPENETRATLLNQWNRSRVQQVSTMAVQTLAKATVQDGVILLTADEYNSPFRHPFDIASQSLTFVRKDSATFSLRRTPAIFDVDRGARITLNGSPEQVSLPLPFAFPFFGGSVDRVFISRFRGLHLSPARSDGVDQYYAGDFLHVGGVISPLLVPPKLQKKNRRPYT